MTEDGKVERSNNKRYANIKRDGGRVYLRPTNSQLRHGKTQIRIWSPEGTPEFDEELDQARLVMGADGPALTGHSLEWLVMSYMRSPDFQFLGPSTKKVRAGLLNDVLIRLDRSRSFLRLSMQEILAIRDSMQDRPEAANARIKSLRQVYKWAGKRGLAETNPAMNVDYLSSKNPTGFYTWTPDEIAQYEDRHELGTMARLAIDLLQFTGVRRSDVVLLGPPHDRSGILHFTEQKNKNRSPKPRLVPILPQLQASIAATETGSFTYLITQFKQPFTSNGFGNWYKKRCKEANLPHCSAHGIRKAAAVRAAMTGATTKQLMAIFGWDSAKMADKYTQAAESHKIALEHMSLLSK